MNSRFVFERSAGFAKRLLDDANLTDAQRIERAYLMALTRRPEPTKRTPPSATSPAWKRLPDPEATSPHGRASATS